MIELIDHPFAPSERLAHFTAAHPNAGAIVTFSGHVRQESASGRVATLELQHHPVLTRSGIETAIAEAVARWPLIGTHIVHRTGRIAAGDAIVFVATASAHRRAAFEAADFLMDYLKSRAPFWKKEHTDQGSSWIEPRAEDHSDMDRWFQQKDPSHGRN